ncbi:MAG: hypothetical protein OWT28_00010 [Firmicutes bacterium]|nr:hypothetical protein [Bacillota bacterium]
MPSLRDRLSAWNNWIRVIVTIGLVTGYFVAISDNAAKRSRASFVSNSILLPASLIWLWLLRSSQEDQDS